MLEHGGRLFEAAQRHGIEPARWLDLSTGINPHAYPVGPINAEAWRRLPEAEDGLVDIARRYYGIDQDIAALTYNEYAHAWRRSGHTVTTHAFSRLPEAAAQSDIVMLCQPNNPTGSHLSSESLHAMLASLRRCSGFMIVDEAYMDATPGDSLLRSVNVTDWEHLIMLRSVGKFFGLAGARAGFALGPPAIMQALNEELGPWALSGPTRAAVAQALNDTIWQNNTRASLQAMAAKLDAVLRRRVHVNPTGTTLFRWFEHPRSAALYAHLAGTAILVRQFAAPTTGGQPSLRFGLPANDQQLARLDAALESFK